MSNVKTIEQLKIIAKDNNMPYIIISGMPGIGKTTSILCLARQLLRNTYQEVILKLNASNEWGINVIWNHIKDFAQKKITLLQGCHKLMILNKADSMTSDTQQALQYIMKIYSFIMYFTFACNVLNKIIKSLQSQCIILQYMWLIDAQVVQRLLLIYQTEDVQYFNDNITALIFNTEDNMRQVINNLQSTHVGFSFINGKNVFKIVDLPHSVKVQVVIKACWEGKIEQAIKGVQKQRRARL